VNDELVPEPLPLLAYETLARGIGSMRMLLLGLWVLLDWHRRGEFLWLRISLKEWAAEMLALSRDELGDGRRASAAHINDVGVGTNAGQMLATWPNADLV
jgi:hypothetical protein